MSSLSSNAGKVNIYVCQKEQFQLWRGFANGKANFTLFKVGERFIEQGCWNGTRAESRDSCSGSEGFNRKIRRKKTRRDKENEKHKEGRRKHKKVEWKKDERTGRHRERYKGIMKQKQKYGMTKRRIRNKKKKENVRKE